MPIEIEAKFRLENPDAMRAVLRRQQARCLGVVLETNRFFDWPDESLRQGDRGLRVRGVVGIAADDGGQIPPERITVTYKGPRQAGPFKTREEVEFAADDAQTASELLQALGLRVTLTFQKRRETWQCDNCTVEIDELPRLGHFLEIEGPDESAVSAVRQNLGLGDVPLEVAPYTSLVHAYQLSHAAEATSLTF